MSHDSRFNLRLHAYVDGELDDRSRGAFEIHRARCAQCQADVLSIMSLKTAVASLAGSVAIPAGLEARVRGHVRRVARRRELAAGLAWPTAGLAAAAAAALLLVPASSVSALVSDHQDWVKSGGRPEISSARPSVLKAWLSARVPDLPPVLARAGGCGAIGARIGRVGDRKASTLTYHCGAHIVDFYAMADAQRDMASAPMAPHVVAAGPITVVAWKRGRLECYAISDLPKAQLLGLAQYIQDHAAEG